MSEQSLADLYAIKSNKGHTHTGSEITSAISTATNVSGGSATITTCTIINGGNLVIKAATTGTAAITGNIVFADSAGLEISRLYNSGGALYTKTGASGTAKQIVTTDQIPTTLPANGGNSATVGGVRITIGITPPTNPVECKELWLDTANNVFKHYISGAWKITNAAYA